MLNGSVTSGLELNLGGTFRNDWEHLEGRKRKADR